MKSKHPAHFNRTSWLPTSNKIPKLLKRTSALTFPFFLHLSQLPMSPMQKERAPARHGFHEPRITECFCIQGLGLRVSPESEAFSQEGSGQCLHNLGALIHRTVFWRGYDVGILTPLGAALMPPEDAAKTRMWMPRVMEEGGGFRV